MGESSPSTNAHRTASAGLTVRFALLTLSDTRTPATDTSGQRMANLITTANHTITTQDILPDDATALKNWLDTQLASPTVDAIITSGGTGITSRDITIPVVTLLLDPILPGFGELFRMLSFDQVGSAAILSQSIAGIARISTPASPSAKPLFALPGSPKAVELALSKLILPEISHLISHLRR